MRTASVVIAILSAGCTTDPGPTPDELLKRLPKPPIQNSVNLPDAVHSKSSDTPGKLGSITVRTGERLALAGRVRTELTTEHISQPYRVDVVKPGPLGKRPSVVDGWLLHTPQEQPEPGVVAYDGFSKVRLPPGTYTLRLLRSNDVLMEGELRVVP